MKALFTMTESGEVGGTTIFEDGTKAYWCEGRSTSTVYLKMDGTVQAVPVYDDSTPYFQALQDGELGAQRAMTTFEEKEWETARLEGGNW